MRALAFIVDEMLERIVKEGFTSQEIKQAIRETLSPHFNKDILNKHLLDSQFVSIFGYLMVYQKDDVFINELKNIINIYKGALKTNSEKTVNTIVFSAEEFGQKENLMWNVKKDTPNIVPEDIYDATIQYMKHLGETLELAIKTELMELYALILISLNKDFEYSMIRKLNFGVIINNILSQGFLKDILCTSPPVEIKLSDWRNISYHHSFYIEGSKIRCVYGKDQKSFTISLEQLKQYTAEIIRASNIIDIGRRIFLFDNMEFLSGKFSSTTMTHDRDVMKIGQLKTSLLTQGFQIVKSSNKESTSEIVVVDLRNNGELNKDELIMRKIHSTQFLYKLWQEVPNDIIKLVYCDAKGTRLFSVWVPKEICIEVNSGLQDLSYMASHLLFSN